MMKTGEKPIHVRSEYESQFNVQLRHNGLPANDAAYAVTDNYLAL
jgi:hypothetical protein